MDKDKFVKIWLQNGGIQDLFDEKPGEEIRALLKSYGFHWAPSEGAWQRQRTVNALNTAKRLVSKIEDGEKNETNIH